MNKKDTNNKLKEVNNTSTLTPEQQKYIEDIVEDAYKNHKWLMDELAK